MANDNRTLTGWPKAVVGDIARDTTTRPAKLRLHATSDMNALSQSGGNGERKVRGTRASRNR